VPEAGPRVRACLWVVRGGRALFCEHEKAGRRYSLLPGGGVDPGEGWDEAAARECQEELGAAAHVGALLGVFENRSPDGSRHILHVTFAAELEGDPAPTGEDPRVVGCHWLGPEELAGTTIFPELTETYLGWLRAGTPPGARYARVPWVE